jgi:hypothetical protein
MPGRGYITLVRAPEARGPWRPASPPSAGEGAVAPARMLSFLRKSATGLKAGSGGGSLLAGPDRFESAPAATD